MNMGAVSPVDIGAAAIVLFTTLRGLHRRLSGELSSLVGVAAAVVFGLLAMEPFGRWIEARTGLPAEKAHALAFILTAAAVTLAMILVGFVLRRIMKIVFDESFDRPAGGVAGFLTGVTAVVLIFLAADLWPHPFLNEQFGRRSMIGRVLIRWMPVLKSKVQEAPAADAVARDVREGAEQASERAREKAAPLKDFKWDLLPKPAEPRIDE